MRYFTILDFQHWVAATFVGLLLVVLAWMAWGGYRTRRMGRMDLSDASMPDSPPESKDHPISPILIFIYIGTICWMIIYMVVVGLLGGPIK